VQRRSFLTRSLGLAAAVSLPRVPDLGRLAGVSRQVGLPSFPSRLIESWIEAENARDGAEAWNLTSALPVRIEGYLDRTSARLGEVVTFRVSTDSPTYRIQAFRMGWYGGRGARLVWESPMLPGGRQGPPVVTAGTNLVEAPWAPSHRLRLSSPGFLAGCYLFRLVGSDGGDQFVPLVIRRTDRDRGAFLYVIPVSTWQACNEWGGYSLYFGRAGRGRDFDHRARVVSFDRPYDNGSGSGDFLGAEFPLVMRMEQLGLDVAYVTSVDVHAEPELLRRYRCVISSSHDEYWSKPMRDGAEAARDAGVNLAFFGANCAFRQIRLEDSPLGPLRREVCYKSAGEDPMTRTNPSLATVNWRASPVSRPEAALVGVQYAGNPVRGDLVVTDPSAWIWDGAGVSRGQRLRGVIGPEFDRVASSSPANIEVIAHSPLDLRGSATAADTTYYSAPSGAGVFASGTIWWLGQLNPGVFDVPAEPTVYAATMNILRQFGTGPAGVDHPSVPRRG
jgi:hypothetical protein